MKRFLSGGIALTLFALTLSTPARAESSRAGSKIGLTAGIGEPFPSIYGFTASYNLAAFLRGGLGLGFIDYTDPSSGGNIKATTIAPTAKLFVPSWNFSPFFEAGLAIVNMTITGGGSASALGGIPASGSFLTLGAGLDWQADGGFCIGASVKMAPTVSSANVVPGIYLGWFF